MESYSVQNVSPILKSFLFLTKNGFWQREFVPGEMAGSSQSSIIPSLSIS